MYEYFCPRCGITYPINISSSECPRCKEMFDLKKDYAVISARKALRRDYTNFWSLVEVLPPTSLKTKITLGEPVTPLIKINYKIHGNKEIELILKNEGLMPTGSFKDRGSSILVSHLKTIGINKLATDSSGNAGVSMAVYSYVADLSLVIYSPSTLSLEKRKMIEIFNSRLVVTESREEASMRAKESGLFYANHSWNPIFFEGTKTFLYEVLKQLDYFDAVFLPLGSGTLFLGFIEALIELNEYNMIENPPKIFLVRPKGYELSKSMENLNVEQSLAEGIAVRYMYRQKRILELINKYDVDLVFIDNKDILSSLREILRFGIFAEPTGVASFAGFKKTLELNTDWDYKRVLIPITGSGFKTLDKIHKLVLTS